jgi:enterochelin esterase-like enzyme
VLWQELGISEKADEITLSEQGAPFLIVMPHEEFHFRPPEKNHFPEAILNELIPWLEEEFDACEERYCRAIGGISRGGSWALRMALLEWNTFGAAGIHSAPLFNGDIESVPDWIDVIPDESLPALYLDIGNIDPAIKNASELNELLNSLGIAHEWHLNQGRHDEEYWESQLNAYLNWYSIQLSKEQ